MCQEPHDRYHVTRRMQVDKLDFLFCPPRIRWEMICTQVAAATRHCDVWGNDLSIKAQELANFNRGVDDKQLHSSPQLRETCHEMLLLITSTEVVVHLLLTKAQFWWMILEPKLCCGVA